MKIEMGESLIYSWLRHIKGCQLVQNNWKVSPSWNLKHEDELIKMMNEVDSYFKEHYNYEIFKKNSSLSQIIRQGECDAMGVSSRDSIVKYHAVEVAYHRNGLNYGSKETTVMKVIEKLVRTAMCLYGFFDAKEAEIVFVSPKIGDSCMEYLREHIDEVKVILEVCGFNFSVDLIANDDFNEKIIQPVLSVANEVDDEAELFLRSCQLVNMFDTQKSRKLQSNHSGNTSKVESANSGSSSETKIGKYVRATLWKCLEQGAVSEEEIKLMQQLEYSSKTFHLDYPLLVLADSEFTKEKHVRYWVPRLIINGVEYRMCNDWYEKPTNNDRPYLEKWLSDHEIDLV